MTLKKGRGLSEHDVKGSLPVTVNETMARKYFPQEDPIGKRILIQQIVPGKTELGPEIPWEVVGVVKDEKVGNLDDKKDDNPGVYVSNDQSPVFFQALVIRAAMDPLALQQSITRAVHQVNKDQALSDIKTLERIKTESLAGNRLNSLMLGGFAAVALLLSAIGIYGVISYSVVQRTHEIGIRSALGASGTDVVKMILKYGILMAGAGLAFGFLATVAFTRLLATLLFGVGARDPVTIAGVGVILAAVALLASYLPAHKASKVDPMICLRYE